MQSLLAMPIIKGRRCLGVLVLGNRLSRACFSPARLEVLELIVGQAASALEHARVHDALRVGEARWRSLVEGAPDIIALIDEHGLLEFVNRSGLRLIGDGEVRGAMALEPVLTPACVPRWREAVAAVLREGRAQELELEFTREVGEARWYVARLAPIELGEPGEPGGLTGSSTASEATDDRPRHPADVQLRAASPRKAVLVATDVSARKRAEADKQRLEAQLRQQQRLESLGTLASGVAHEINNPIQGIMNYAELITARARDSELVDEFAGEIIRESDRVAVIVRNLLAFSRQEAEQPFVEARLVELVEDTLSLVHAILRKDQIELLVDVPPQLPPVRCRAQQIQQIIMNLVTNARDALNSIYGQYDERKVIELRAQQLERDGRPWLRLTVADRGPGIAPEVLPRIFDPFYTTKGRDQGTGLGLAVSHGIARDHGGELSVDSELGRGARFFVDLPAVGR